MAFWWSAHWGFAWRQEFNPREYSIDPPPSVFNEDPSRQKNMRGHSLTVRYRGFGTGGMEYDFGAGVETVKYDRASFREGANQRSFRSVGNSGLVFERMCCNFPKAARERLVEPAGLRLMPPPRTSC